MNFENFSKWVRKMLLPNLPPNCLIVLDNAPYHSVEMNKPPTLAQKKEAIQEWLERNNINDEN
jgi:hypothetical protein